MSVTGSLTSAVAPVVVQSFQPSHDLLAQHEISPDVQLAAIVERDQMKKSLTPFFWLVGGVVGAAVAWELFRGRRGKAPQ